MKAILCVALVLVFWAQFTESSCPDGWLHHKSSCYHFSHDTETMLNAARICKHMGGTIAEIETDAENYYITSQAKLYRQNFWIGLTDIQEEGIWKWYESKRSLTTSGFTDWADRQPDNNRGQENCVYVMDHWADAACYSAYNYVCEKADEVVSIVG